jgi:hypothetical protein
MADLNTAEWTRGGKQAVLRTYLKLHEGKLGAHWLWCAIEQIANGEPEAQVLAEYGYAPDGSHYLGHYASGDEATVTINDAEPHCRVERIPLTDAQRKLLTVTGDVSIPGVAPSGAAALAVASGKPELAPGVKVCQTCALDRAGDGPAKRCPEGVNCPHGVGEVGRG